MKTVYAVFRLDRTIIVYGERVPLPEGQYLVPVFDNYTDAKELAGDRFDVIEMSINEK